MSHHSRTALGPLGILAAIVIVVVAGGLSGCQESSTAQSPPPVDQKPAGPAPAEVAEASKTTAVDARQPDPPPRDVDSIRDARSNRAPERGKVLAAGTPVKIRLSHRVSTGTNVSGELFEGVLDRHLRVAGEIVVPAGTTVIGRLSQVQQSGRVRGKARLSMTLTEILQGDGGGDDVRSIRTNTLSFRADSSTGADLTKIGGGAGIGAAVGAIRGGGRGAALGAAIGAGAGSAAVVMTRGKEVEFEAEQAFEFKLAQDLKIS